VQVSCHGVAVAGSPFNVSVWDAAQVGVFNVPPAGRVGKPAMFNSTPPHRSAHHIRPRFI